ncbi:MULTISPECIES: bacteriohemerythrin [Stenotrophomonas]|uniref:Bacteriohemerythrin n=1 Tax=Stenotrophomonas maltophilia TaxID=40324 RepID=A0A246I015_STEMA|nr:MULTISPECIES: bacteriohemerythrin [Stenotrophomonas]MBW8776146.1 bacteriohemerythrin [Stenotrophomonas sp.]CRP88607.1 McHr [Pseudomonas aeruginosa]ELK6801978.1 bacteriohemerythrin [Stenotrophomonas maltophilia]KXU98136.1 bacteriohemerythrin [Stenotrophomonas sp. DDT-1]MBA0271231.1 bacteriohemerythrin [Stenotrophomonas maltophilia]
MALLVWQDDLNIGIDVIDQQHRRIIEMLNHLHVAQTSLQRAAVGEVIDEVVDYTMSHFAFEEELMEEAGYPFCAAHKRVHEIFIKRVAEYRLRFQAGEDISDELRTMLSRWLFNHIRGDDQAYAEQVKAHLNQFTREHQGGGWLGRTLKRFFG